uniref:Uncharacterized protein n=1 Tax=Octopus bimaculoides TaxID=37653 RepID=A0A0L8HZK4_OCTBM
MVYGAPLTVPGEFLPNTTSDPLKDHPYRTNSGRLTFSWYDVTFDSPYDGLYEVIRLGDKSFQLLIGGRLDTVSIDRLKPAHLDIDSRVQVAQPPNRVRPRQITPTLGKEQSPKNRVTTRTSRTIKKVSRFH